MGSRHRRDRKINTSPLMNTDDTDQNRVIGYWVIENRLPLICADEPSMGWCPALSDENGFELGFGGE
jgi:hypothetical protein